MNTPVTWQNSMAHHGRSFHLASTFFPKTFFGKVNALYALCRWIDDAADEAPSVEISHRELDKILKDLKSESPELLPVKIYRDCELDIGYIEDLIDGARQDLQEVRLLTEGQLIQYCYKVAGTVGLAMNDLMEVKVPHARAFAVDLGIAMQLTNICRDIKEDALNNRIYIPHTLLEKHNVTPESLLDFSVSEESISMITRELLTLADTYYESAQHAFVCIPWKMRGAIIIASSLYGGIGHKLRRQGANPLRGRVFLSNTEKGFKLCGALIRWLASGFSKPSSEHSSELHEPLASWKGLRGFHS